MPFLRVPNFLEQQLTQHQIAYKRMTIFSLGECITLTRTKSTILVDSGFGIRYGHIQRQRQGQSFETVRDFGHQLTEAQAQFLLSMLVAQG